MEEKEPIIGLPSEKKSEGSFLVEKPKRGYWELHPSFSFKHCLPEHRKYPVKNKCHKEDLHHFMKHLASMSSLRWKQIEGTKDKFHMHPVPNKENVNIPEGFQLMQFKAFQEARVIGYFNIDNIFEVILFDREHDYCPSENW